MADTKGKIRYAVACLLCLTYPVMVFLSFNAGANLSAVIIGGWLGLVIVLLYGADPIVEIIEAWRG